MKKIAALGLAGLVAASSLAVTAGTASAMPPGPPPPWIHHHHPHGGWGGGWGWGGPFLFGLGVGTLYSNSYGYQYGWDDHVRWCATHYRTYNPSSDTFFIRPGVPARCVAPFDRY
jgi:hypothetical protein